MSNVFKPDESKFSVLKDKVVVLTGGAHGIGAATVRYLHQSGALIVFGDFDETAGAALVEELKSQVSFLKINVAIYKDTLSLFKCALQTYGRVDYAVAVAGVGERGNWFGSDLTIEDVERPETNVTIEVNLLGVLYFCRIAVPFLKKNRTEGEDRGLILVGSAAGFRESPGLPVYQATKHGVQGIVRSLRKTLYERDRIRLNVVCPGVTKTQMTDGMFQTYAEKGLPINLPDDVAVIILGLLTEDEVYGKGIYVGDHQGWDVEDGLTRTMPDWLGKEPTRRLREGLAFVASGETWDFMKAVPSRQ